VIYVDDTMITGDNVQGISDLNSHFTIEVSDQRFGITTVIYGD